MCRTSQLLVPIFTACGEQCDEWGEHSEVVSVYSLPGWFRSRHIPWGHCSIPMSEMWELPWSIFLKGKLERKWEGHSWIHDLSSWPLIDFSRCPWEKSSNFPALQFLSDNKRTLSTIFGRNFENKHIKDCEPYHARITKGTTSAQKVVFICENKKATKVKMLTFRIDGGVV